MKVLSWDVGIIHLAYCILEKNEDTCKIIEWNNINLLNNINYDCHGFINSDKSTNKCDKPCSNNINSNVTSVRKGPRRNRLTSGMWRLHCANIGTPCSMTII